MSIDVRHATEHYNRTNFAFQYRQLAPASVMLVTRQALDQGIPISALRIFLLNRDIRDKDGRVQVRRTPQMRARNAIFWTLLILHYTSVCLMAAVAPGSSWLKIVVILALVVIYCPLYYGFSLISTRPQRLMDLYGDRLDEICANLSSRPKASVRRIRVK
mgnify:CR=1 FL=1